jgi:hypothetical protein
MSTGDDFNWDDVADDVAIPEQAAIAVYLNPHGEICCRQAGQYCVSEDSYIIFHPSHALTLAKAILEKAGLEDLVIVHVSHLATQKAGEEVLAAFPDQDTIDKVEHAGRAADVEGGHDRGDHHDQNETKKDKTAAERKRRQREKQRQRDRVTEAVTHRDIERDTVTKAPRCPELDLNGGQNKALAH